MSSFLTSDASARRSVARRFVLKAVTMMPVMCSLVPIAAQAHEGEVHEDEEGLYPTDRDGSVLPFIDLEHGVTYDLATVTPGELVIFRHENSEEKWQYYAVLHRTPAQVMASEDSLGKGKQPQADAQRVQDRQWLVVDMACTHKLCQLAYVDDGETTFLCPCHRSTFDASGRVLKGRARENLLIPAYRLTTGADGTPAIIFDEAA